MSKIKNKMIIGGGVVLFAAVGATLFMNQVVSSYEECVAAGNPVMEKYPPVCRDAKTGNTFTKKVDDYWQYDGIALMKNSEDGTYACFGCSTGTEGKGMCIDPAPIMEPVEETYGRHCSSEFEVIDELSD